MTTKTDALAVREQTAIEARQPGEIDPFRLAAEFAKSGYFQDAKDASQAIVKIVYGQEMGIKPASAMSSIHIVQGKPVIGATALASRLTGRYEVIELNEQQCTLHFFKTRVPYDPNDAKTYFVETFTLKDAERAGLLGKNQWKNYPQNMLFARAMSNGARFYCADIFSGATVYTPEELGANTDESGDIVLDPTNDYKTAKPVHTPQMIIEVKDESKAVAAPAAVCPEIRNEVESVLQRINIDPAKSLKKFDTFTQMDECENAIIAVLRQAVKTGIAGQVNAENGWSDDDITGYLSEWSVEGVDAASLEQLRAIYADQIKTKML